VVRNAVSNEFWMTTLYYESVTGENSTLIPEFKVFAEYCDTSNINAQYLRCPVEAITIDQFVNQHGLSPRFVKIDIEGAELNALEGMARTIRTFRPRIMLEVNLNAEEVWRYLK